MRFATPFSIVFLALIALTSAQEPVYLGFNYPETGPYAVQGLDQLRAAQLAVDEINKDGGILGRPVKLVARNSRSNAGISKKNAIDLIDKHDVQMVFGGSSSGVAVAVGHVCAEKQVPFFETLTYSTTTTCEQGRRTTFRECNDSWSAASALAGYMNENFKGKKFLYITADYTWGHSTEEAFRRFTGTEDTEQHKQFLTRFPGAREHHFKRAAAFAKRTNPDVLVVVEFGRDMERMVRHATELGLKSKMAIIVPQYKAAVERAGSFDSSAVVQALEGHDYTMLKDKQTWRRFDHQSVQSVFAVRCKPEATVRQDQFGLDFFEILSSVPGNKCFRTKEQWQSLRKLADKPPTLEPLPGELAKPGK